MVKMKKYLFLILILLLIVGCSSTNTKTSPTEQVNVKQDHSTEKPQIEPVKQEATTTVEISGFAFNPLRLEIKKGTTVTWTNKDSAPHTVTGSFADSGILNTGETFSHTFNEVGEFEYGCVIHPSMKAIVAVTE